MTLERNNIEVLTRRNGENGDAGYTMEFSADKDIGVGVDICVGQRYSPCMLLWDGYVRNAGQRMQWPFLIWMCIADRWSVTGIR